MAIKYGTDAQAYLSQQTSGGRNHVRMAHDVILFKDTFITTGDETADDTVYLCREIPGGSTIVPVFSRIHTVSQPAATAFVVDLGANGVGDNILDGVAVNSAGIVTPTTREIEVPEATRLIMTLKTVTGAVTAGRVIDFYFALRQTS